ncbi:hypothetical protein [Shimia thalassica]|uniref:hypothetical protein n=1 Tax=Shimia thalassica TaxID=1715693 RepID=UPI002734A063|nr:hypothetical protein [Shimia thalassica]
MDVAKQSGAIIHQSKEGSNLKIDTENIQSKRPDGLGSKGLRSRSRSVEIDIDAYQSLLDQSGLTNQQRTEFLEAIWSVIVAFIDLGFEVHPAQQSTGNIKPSRHLTGIAKEFVRDAA